MVGTSPLVNCQDVCICVMKMLVYLCMFVYLCNDNVRVNVVAGISMRTCSV